ncbi:MAG: RsmD family RNA methyltransferase [Candidatus Omnitrophica bacterium]|nr:RsmD family RNA methyltransferase [Candidatus Omnitrophota bacterium]
MNESLGCKLSKYVTASLANEFRRLLHFIIGALEIVKVHSFEKQHNIKTDGATFVEDTFSLYKDGVMYQPTPYHVLAKIIGYLKPGPEDIFVDFGSGKGRVVFFTALRELKKVIGVEMDKSLVNIANNNLANFKSGKTAIEFINEEAVNFKIKDETIFFMFNPFGSKTLEKVLGNIKRSLLDNPRQIRLAYYAPAHRYLLDNEDWLVLEKNITNLQCSVWRNKI